MSPGAAPRPLPGRRLLAHPTSPAVGQRSRQRRERGGNTALPSDLDNKAGAPHVANLKKGFDRAGRIPELIDIVDLVEQQPLDVEDAAPAPALSASGGLDWPLDAAIARKSRSQDRLVDQLAGIRDREDELPVIVGDIGDRSRQAPRQGSRLVAGINGDCRIAPVIGRQFDNQIGVSGHEAQFAAGRDGAR